MSRDMLSYDSKEMRRYGFSKERLRSILLRHIQTRSMRRANGVIFLTNFAAQAIQQVTGKLRRVGVIPHGVGENFRHTRNLDDWPANPGVVRCLYVSNTDMYKHQWMVVQGVAALRERGHNVHLILAGGGSGLAQKLLDLAIDRLDPQRAFVRELGPIAHKDVPDLLKQADLFVFASSCENMPNTLVEGMASGLPVACSDRGPMPEILQDGGIYFDPEEPTSIATAIERLILERDLRLFTGSRAKQRSDQYSWSRCARDTWTFLADVAAESRVGGANDL